jgi:hypothetical protein
MLTGFATAAAQQSVAFRRGFMSTKKRAIIIICAVVIVLIFVLAITSAKDHSEPEAIRTQEDYQMELLKMLDKMELLAYQGDISIAPGRYLIGYWRFQEDMNLPNTYKGSYYEIRPRTEISPKVEIFHEILALCSHCYRLYGGTESVATKEDIAKLYNSYDENLEGKFLALYNWWARLNGDALFWYYDDAIRTAHSVYLQQYGFFNGKELYGEMLAEDKIALDQFVRENPDFLPKEVYYSELYSMRIINDEEHLALGKAAMESQDSIK